MKKIIKLIVLLLFVNLTVSCDIVIDILQQLAGSNGCYDESGEGLKLLTDVLEESHLEVPQYAPGAALPSIGSPKALVVPVQFKPVTIRGLLSGSNSYGSFKEGEVEKIEQIFNGTSSSTGWESVSSYYDKSSNGILNLQFDIADVFTLQNDFKYYQNLDYGDEQVFKEVLAGLDSSIDFSDYDYNNDGLIDGIYLIYSMPYGGSPRQDTALSNAQEEDFWWAWVSWLSDYKTQKYDGVYGCCYMWASIDFANDAYDEAQRKYIPINASTYIHETGHMLGLDDYYNYDCESNYEGGVGGADMMDATVGDHSPVSKILMGWTNPTVVTETTSIRIQTMQNQVNLTKPYVLLIPKSWNNSYFDEYLLVDIYTPTGLNKLTAGQFGLFSIQGVRIYHVDARISSTIGDQFNLDYYTIFSFNNTTSSHPFVKLLEGDGDNSLMKPDYSFEHGYYPPEASNSDLFLANQKLENHKWYDGTDCGFEIFVRVVSQGEAQIEITFNQ